MNDKNNNKVFVNPHCIMEISITLVKNFENIERSSVILSCQKSQIDIIIKK